MKLVPYADNNVFISEDRHILKADKLQDIPDIIHAKQIYSELKPEFEVTNKRDGYGLELTKRGKIKEKFAITELKSGCAKAYYELEILDRFLQKSSKLYLALDDGQLFIQNRNSCYFISASVFDDYSFEVV
jgi:hypothetical protein